MLTLEFSFNESSGEFILKRVQVNLFLRGVPASLSLRGFAASSSLRGVLWSRPLTVSIGRANTRNAKKVEGTVNSRECSGKNWNKVWCWYVCFLVGGLTSKLNEVIL